MITYINAKNADAYQVLFSKATDILKEAQPSSIGDSFQNGFTWDDFAIGSLNEYFAYLPDILATFERPNQAQLTPQELDEQRAFVRLPIDEDMLFIDADKRSISIPATFARYGVGVQGDQIAEIVYFVIDRYFDSIDLSSYDINIAIQWEARDADKNVLPGISKNFGKEIVNIDGKQKIVFGWPITNELTQTNGTIKFAVRFYTVDSINKKFTYSFTTLPAELTVNASLDYDILNNAVNEIDHGLVVTSRIHNSGIYDPNAERPDEPTITTPLFVYSPAGYETAKVIDLPANENGVQLAIGAKPTTSGVIVYKWKQYAYDDTTGDYSHSESFVLQDGDTVTVAHPEVVSSISGDAVNGRYYRKVTSGLDEVYQLVSLDDFADEDGVYTYITDDGFETATGGFEHLYKELSVITVHNVGKYAVDVAARVLANTATKTMTEADAIKIPGPEKPDISFDDGIVVSEEGAHIIANNGTAILTVNAEEGENKLPVEVRGDSPQVTLSYTWKKKTDGDPITIVADGETYVINNEDPHSSSLTISGLSAGELDEYYFAEVTALRNGVRTSAASGDYRITNAPEIPVIKVRTWDPSSQNFVLVEKDYDSSNNIETVTRRAGQPAQLSFSVEPLTQSDGIDYLWMKMRVEDNVPSDWIDENTAKLQADLGDAIEEFVAAFGNPDGQEDEPISNATIDPTRFGDNFDTIGEPTTNDFEDNGPKQTVTE